MGRCGSGASTVVSSICNLVMCEGANKTCSFINRVSDSHQVEEPDQFYGGIVADPMGFGKTLIMIALVATDLSNSPQLTSETRLGDEFEGDPGYTSPQTLIIIPPSRTYRNIP